jgi:hypothetical protein
VVEVPEDSCPSAAFVDAAQGEESWSALDRCRQGAGAADRTDGGALGTSADREYGAVQLGSGALSARERNKCKPTTDREEAGADTFSSQEIISWGKIRVKGNALV